MILHLMIAIYVVKYILLYILLYPNSRPPHFSQVSFFVFMNDVIILFIFPNYVITSLCSYLILLCPVLLAPLNNMVFNLGNYKAVLEDIFMCSVF